ncbi:expressed unknown protein [Seminavis robusta]|uniref:Uncharacterized protein n=1 Tax=Seminavis robusta TaxID=568900 RepID=A0A9N8I034_9STRA|nr:expressed unknown protein [Seminavis robusta]|eukprot:Sro2495_g329300.1 n/a (184) ;mRNA; f:12943-13494
MNLFKKLFRRKKSKALVKETTESDSRNTSATEQSWKHDLVVAFVQEWNNHDFESAKKLVSTDFVVVFVAADNMELEYQDFAAEVNKIFDAFPDFAFKYESIEEQADGAVVLRNLIPHGHHTAKPYAFGPCPPIEPSGQYVENSPETLYFHFNDSKISKQVVHAQGEMTGPPGIYTQLGGFPAL